MSLCAAIFVVLSARSENDVTGTIGNSDSSGLLHPMLPNADGQGWPKIKLNFELVMQAKITKKLCFCAPW